MLTLTRFRPLRVLLGHFVLMALSALAEPLSDDGFPMSRPITVSSRMETYCAPIQRVLIDARRILMSFHLHHKNDCFYDKQQWPQFAVIHSVPKCGVLMTLNRTTR